MKLFAIAMSVEYMGGESVDVRSDTHYVFVSTDDIDSASTLADRLATYMKTDEGGDYIAADTTSVGEVMGTVPQFVTVLTDADIPKASDDDEQDDEG